ncbi:hypothetical protein GCM10012319_11680 [Comamonas sp. KCTC 72670]|nr:hypothetical protein GCM10012319_11680 [Comamonas sp. KCTC 72670]
MSKSIPAKLLMAGKPLSGVSTPGGPAGTVDSPLTSVVKEEEAQAARPRLAAARRDTRRMRPM